MTPKPFPLDGLLCKQALRSCIIPSTSRAPLISKIRNLEVITLVLNLSLTVVAFGLDLVALQGLTLQCLLIKSDSRTIFNNSD